MMCVRCTEVTRIGIDLEYSGRTKRLEVRFFVDIVGAKYYKSIPYNAWIICRADDKKKLEEVYNLAESIINEHETSKAADNKKRLTLPSIM